MKIKVSILQFDDINAHEKVDLRLVCEGWGVGSIPGSLHLLQLKVHNSRLADSFT